VKGGIKRKKVTDCGWSCQGTKPLRKKKASGTEVSIRGGINGQLSKAVQTFSKEEGKVVFGGSRHVTRDPGHWGCKKIVTSCETGDKLERIQPQAKME